MSRFLVSHNGRPPVDMSYRAGVDLVMDLAFPLLDPKREPGDLDISQAAMAVLDAAPTDPQAFRAYCEERCPSTELEEMDEDGLNQVRTFIADCARLGGVVHYYY